MITESVLKFLQEAIQEYDKKCNKTYLIAFNTSKKGEFSVIQLRFSQSHFWHLLGCKLDKDSNAGKADTYLRCKNKEDISDKVSTVHGYSEIQEKYQAFMAVFDFIKNAKNTKIGYAENCPEQFIFRAGAGNAKGIIGYDYPEKGDKDCLIPKSAQNKNISSITRDLKRIVFILSKESDKTKYTKLEYEIKPGVFEEMRDQIPACIQVYSDLQDVSEPTKTVINSQIDIAIGEAAVTKVN